MFDKNYDHRIAVMKSDLSSLIDFDKVNITQWAQAIGLDVETTPQKEFLKHAKKMMGFTWEDLAAWVDRDKDTVLHWVYPGKHGSYNRLDYIKRCFIVYQLREYYRFANIRATFIPSKYWGNIHYER